MTQIVAAVKVPVVMHSHDYNHLLSLVSESRREQAKRFVRQEDAYRSLLGEVLVRAVVSRSAGMANETIQFTKNPYGKPLLYGKEAFAFNVSHSGEWVVLIAGQGMVGIDIERIGTIDLKVAQRFFTAVEYEDLIHRPVDERVPYFYDLWTLKESYLKAIGTGLSTALDSFTVRIAPQDGSATLTPNHQGLHFRRYPIFPGYMLSACSSIDDWPESVTVYEMEELYRFL